VRAVIAADLAPVKIGSLESQLFTVARLLETVGVEVMLSFGGRISGPVRRHFATTDESLTCCLGPLAEAGARKSWLRHLKEQKPDILWLHFFPPVGRFIAQIRHVCPRATIYFSDHVSRGYDQKSSFRRLVRRFQARLYARCIDCYIGVSRFVSRRLVENDLVPADRVRTVYNGIDLTRFRPAEQRGPHIAAVCHMIPEKGVAILLQALALLKRRGHELPCQLAGTGPRLAEYQGYVRSHDLSSVSFLGSRDDVPEILRTAQVTIVPSLWEEAFGLAAAESLAAGVPVIASRIGALPEIIDDGANGLLVPAGDCEALANALLTLFSDPSRREGMASAARQKAEREFDLSRLSGRIVDIILAREL
jgi:glycosyltransferase involved in cell wall biosynthesis